MTDADVIQVPAPLYVLAVPFSVAALVRDPRKGSHG